MDSSRSGMPSGSFVSETTYNGDYKFIKRALPLRFHDYISFVVKTPHKVVPRSFPHYSLHTSPHPILKFEKSTLGFGPTGGEYERPGRTKNTSWKAKTNKTRSDCMEGINGTAKSKSRSEDEKEEKDENTFGNKDIEITENNNDTVLKRFSAENASQDLVYKMTREGIYKTTARRAAEECALPVRARPMVLAKILGTNEDRELFHSVYKRTGTWKTKTVPKYWERCQERPIYENPKKYRPCRSVGSSATNPKLLRWRSPLETERMILPNVKTPEMQQLPTPADLHIRPAPGYGGFVPKLPVIPGRARDPRLALSSSATTYRKPLPSGELKILEHAHKGPLSKLVTTTSPCNPFKNITVCPDHLFVY